MVDDWFPLAELTGRVGALVWVEEALGELLAGWSGDDTHPGAARLFFGCGRRHAGHAVALRGWLPTSPALAARERIVAPTTGWESTLQRLAGLAGDRTTVRLDSLTQVIDPWIDREVGAIVACTDTISEAALHRVLRSVSVDHHDDGAAAAELVSALRGPATVLADRQFVSSLDLG